jgi:lipopolysaccharide biosynthesis glycosyltransferase
MKIAHEINKSDEELLNFYFHKDIGNIDMRYNMGLHLYVDKFINIIINITGIDKQYLNDELLNCFKIIHYTTYYKPNR